MSLRRPASARERARIAASVVSVTVVAMGFGLGAVATGAEPFDGAYKGTFSGSSSGSVEFSIAGSNVTVTQPGSGSGSLSGSSISMVVGDATVNGLSCRYDSTGQVSVTSAGEGVATGTWSATCSDGATGNGTWEARRPAVAPSASPSASTPSSSPTGSMPRTLTLVASPKRLPKAGRTTLTAALSDCTQASSVDFQVRRGGEFRSLGAVSTGTDCEASIKRRVTTRTTFRAQSPPDGAFAPATSRVVTVRLERR